MDVVILAGGQGTRLAPVVPDLPKPLAPLAQIPFLDFLLAHLSKCPAVHQWIFSLGYKAEAFTSYFAARTFPVPHVISLENAPLGTGGAVRKALDFTQSSELLILNGDSFLDVSWISFCHLHAAMDADLTIAAVEMDDARRFGSLEWDRKTNKLVSFKEKQQEPASNWINGGVYLVKRTLLEEMPKQLPFSFEEYLAEKVTTKRFFVYPCSSFFCDIGTPASYAYAQEVFLNKCPLPPFLLQEGPAILARS